MPHTGGELRFFLLREGCPGLSHTGMFLEWYMCPGQQPPSQGCVPRMLSKWREERHQTGVYQNRKTLQDAWKADLSKLLIVKTGKDDLNVSLIFAC